MVDYTDGQLRRICRWCGVEVVITKPTLVSNEQTSRHQREVYARAIRKQVCWEALQPCPGNDSGADTCRKWWSDLVRRASLPPQERKPDGHDFLARSTSSGPNDHSDETRRSQRGRSTRPNSAAKSSGR
jgi:hypothetical protein